MGETNPWINPHHTWKKSGLYPWISMETEEKPWLELEETLGSLRENLVYEFVIMRDLW